MIAQLFLSAALCGLITYAWGQYRLSPPVSTLGVAVGLAGLYFVWMPGHATKLAEWAGIGRGVDLIIYAWMVISGLILLNLHLKLRAQLELITRLARYLAIHNPEQSHDTAGSALG